MSPAAAIVRSTITTTKLLETTTAVAASEEEFESTLPDKKQSCRKEVARPTTTSATIPLTMATGEESSLSTSSSIEEFEKVDEIEDEIEEAEAECSSSPAAAAVKVRSYSNIVVAMTFLLVCCSLATSVDALKCHMCGQYNEGVGSITPCLNYSDQYAHLYLKECPKKTEKFCVKYVSELSTVRDCSTECVEKEIWETQTYCCNMDGCNGSSSPEASIVLMMFMPLLYVIFNTALGNHHTLQERR